MACRRSGLIPVRSAGISHSRSMRGVLAVQLHKLLQRLAKHHYNPNGDPAFPRSHSGASYRVRKHYTAECVAPHRRHRTPRFGCLNPNGAAPEPVDASAAPITQRLRRGGGTRVARGIHRSSIPTSHHRTSHHQCSPKSRLRLRSAFWGGMGSHLSSSRRRATDRYSSNVGISSDSCGPVQTQPLVLSS
jgi:hypothetical protein